jgi:hypothetical protein
VTTSPSRAHAIEDAGFDQLLDQFEARAIRVQDAAREPPSRFSNVRYD